jgi:hypothetical protein
MNGQWLPVTAVTQPLSGKLLWRSQDPKKNRDGRFFRPSLCVHQACLQIPGRPDDIVVVEQPVAVGSPDDGTGFSGSVGRKAAAGFFQPEKR